MILRTLSSVRKVSASVTSGSYCFLSSELKALLLRLVSRSVASMLLVKVLLLSKLLGLITSLLRRFDGNVEDDSSEESEVDKG